MKEMKKILIFDNEFDENNGILTDTILQVCKKYGGVLFVGRHKIFQTCENPDFLIMQIYDFSEINLSGVISVFGNDYKNNCNQKLNIHNMTSIVDTSVNTKNILKFVSEIGGTAISCSMCGHDTVTVSGIEENENFNEYLISLTRCVKTISGNIIEPHDFRVRTDKKEIYPILAACGVLILCGIDSMKGYDF